MSNYAVTLAARANLSAPSNGVYNFGTGDFTLEAWVQPADAGTIISRKSTEGMAGNGGFLLVLKPDGSIKFATDNGTGFFEADSAATSVLDGQWHHVAAVRQGAVLAIYLDGSMVPSATRGNATPPLNVNSSMRLLIGATDQNQEPYNAYSGMIDEVRLWNVARSAAQLQQTMFTSLGEEAASLAALVGYYSFDFCLGIDYSATHNNLSSNGAVHYTTPGAPISVAPASLFALLYEGQYHTATKFGGASGQWNANADFYVTEEGYLVFHDHLIMKPVVLGNTVSWNAADGNPDSGSITFMLKSDSAYFWPDGLPTGDLFQGWLQSGSAGRVDFRGLAMAMPGPCAFMQSALNGLVLDAGQAMAGSALTLQALRGSMAQHFCLTQDGTIMHMVSQLVLDLQDGSINAGTAVLLMPRQAGRQSQKWTVSGDGHLVNTAAPTLVAQVASNNPAPGTALVLGTRVQPASASQVWLTLSNLQFVANVGSGLSLDTKNSTATPEVVEVVVSQKMNVGTDQQLWYFVQGFLVNSKNGQVASIAGNANAPGSKIVLQPMSATNRDHQLWRLQNGRFLNTASGLVMDIASSAAGADVITAASVGTSQTQVWAPYVTGPSRMLLTAPTEETKAVSRRSLSAATSDKLQISVKTSNDWFAGYDGEVQITLFNTQYTQSTFTLSNSSTHSDPFERGNIDVFEVDGASFFSTLTSVLIHKEQSFIDDWWKIDWIEVYDDSRKTTYTFDFHGKVVSEWANCDATNIVKPGTAPAQVGKYPGQPAPDWIDHTFVMVADSSFDTTYFDCAGGHDGAGKTTNIISNSAKLTDYVRMATGYDLSPAHPWQAAYGTNNVEGVGTCGIRASGWQYWQGQCHQMVNRLLYAGAPSLTLADVSPADRAPAAYGASVLMFGPYGADFDAWCRAANFPKLLTPQPDYVWDYVRKYLPWGLARDVLSLASTMRGQWANTPAAAPDGPVVKEFIKAAHAEGVTNDQLHQLVNLTITEIEHDEL